MRSLLLLALFALPTAAEPPLAEKFLHDGQLAVGEQTLERELKAHPKDDQLRYGLGIIRLVRGVERLGQSLYEYGANTGSPTLGFPRLPLPKNPSPNAITYPKFRGILDDFRRDLERVEATLAGITDDNVKLTLRLAEVKFDLDGDGKPTDRFLEFLKTSLGRRPDFLATNPEFRVGFDRGDVAWFRSYCHLGMALADLVLSFDLEQEFLLDNYDTFPNVRPKFEGTPQERVKQLSDSRRELRILEPARLGRVREHLLQVVKLNRESWRFIRAETDDDFEWLPNPKQKGVIGLPVRAEMIDTWLGFMDEMEALLEGKKLIPVWMFWKTDGKGLNLKTILDDPPASFDGMKITAGQFQAKYLEKGASVDLQTLLNTARVFDGSLFGLYAVYFN